MIQIIVAAVRDEHVGARDGQAVVVAPLVVGRLESPLDVERVVAEGMVTIGRVDVLVLRRVVVVNVSIGVLGVEGVVMRECIGGGLHVGRGKIRGLEVRGRGVAQAVGVRESAGCAGVELVEGTVGRDQVPTLLKYTKKYHNVILIESLKCSYIADLHKCSSTYAVLIQVNHRCTILPINTHQMQFKNEITCKSK